MNIVSHTPFSNPLAGSTETPMPNPNSTSQVALRNLPNENSSPSPYCLSLKYRRLACGGSLVLSLLASAGTVLSLGLLHTAAVALSATLSALLATAVVYGLPSFCIGALLCLFCYLLRSCNDYEDPEVREKMQARLYKIGPNPSSPRDKIIKEAIETDFAAWRIRNDLWPRTEPTET